MSSSVKITGLLALISSVAAVPHAGGHGRFHNRAYGYNTTAIAGPTGTGTYDEGTTTLDTTSTSTQILYSTIYAIPSSAAAEDVDVAGVSTGQCGGTVTVTASEKVTVTVTPGGDVAVPTSSAAVVESTAGNGYGAPSSVSPVAGSSSAAVEYPAETPAVETSSAAETLVAETSSVVETPVAGTSSAVETPVAGTSSAVETPVAETSTSAAGYSAVTPEASSSSEAAYVTPSMVQKPVESASATASSAAATSSAASGNTYTGTKRGLAYNEASLCTSFGSKFGYAYNWGQTESTDIGTNFIPMMHGPSKSTAEEWLANVDKAVENGSTAVMGFNECDHAAQCNLAPEAACSAWKQYMNPVKAAHPDVTIIGPSITNGQAPMGLDWLQRFQSCCADATIDASNMHFYDDYNEGLLGRFQKQVEDVAALYGKKVWITEFGINTGTATDAEAASFLKEAMAYLDSSDKVQGYSWFMVGGTQPYSLNSGDSLSPLGQVYAST
jgi:hypothetical protein